MTLAEWIEAQAIVAALWPHAPELTAEQIRIQHRLLADVEQDAALAAIQAAACSGAAYPPTPGEVARRCAQHAAGGEAVSWPAAAALIRQAAMRFGHRREGDALRWLAEQSPHVARFAVDHGWRQLCMEPVDGEHGGAVLTRLERSYRSVASELDREIAEKRVLPRVADRLRAIAAGPSAATGPRRLNVRAALPAPDTEAA